ncbi:hypothetical protein BJA5080_02361 [Bradyrhizobium diazoefficiens SEMIA 5080]|uniref:Uncharacterized protein n=1 Tax=Bradyrhizobium diazoefficiens SEMIA 5080 TaxID=754504 RepID=A0A837C9P5_9BRAD|nr:hypothetical protein BJA5080_02361 [Bradyrhizobium diazoefficiens SEMIA 5080]
MLSVLPHCHVAQLQKFQPPDFNRRSCRRPPHLGMHRHSARARRLRRVRAPAASSASGFRAAPTSAGRPGMPGPASNLASCSCRSRQPSPVHCSDRR